MKVNVVHIGQDSRFNDALSSDTIDVQLIPAEDVHHLNRSLQDAALVLVDLTTSKEHFTTLRVTLQQVACPTVGFSYGIDPAVVESAKYVTGRSPLTREQLQQFVQSLATT